MENLIIVPNHMKNVDYYENPSWTHFMDKLCLKGKQRNKKLFLQIQSINIMYHNIENMIVEPNDEKIIVYYENVSLTHLMDKL